MVQLAAENGTNTASVTHSYASSQSAQAALTRISLHRQHVNLWMLRRQQLLCMPPCSTFSAPGCISLSNIFCILITQHLLRPPRPLAATQPAHPCMHIYRYRHHKDSPGPCSATRVSTPMVNRSNACTRHLYALLTASSQQNHAGKLPLPAFATGARLHRARPVGRICSQSWQGLNAQACMPVYIAARAL